jgi:hypothetical protein
MEMSQVGGERDGEEGRTVVSDSTHEVLDVRSREASKSLESEGRVLSDAGCSKLWSQKRALRGQIRGERCEGEREGQRTWRAAAAHLAFATSTVVPWISGTAFRGRWKRRKW